jgi:hypothetical protein
MCRSVLAGWRTAISARPVAVWAAAGAANANAATSAANGAHRACLRVLDRDLIRLPVSSAHGKACGPSVAATSSHHLRVCSRARPSPGDHVRCRSRGGRARVPRLTPGRMAQAPPRDLESDSDRYGRRLTPSRRGGRPSLVRPGRAPSRPPTYGGPVDRAVLAGSAPLASSLTSSGHRRYSRRSQACNQRRWCATARYEALRLK